MLIYVNYIFFRNALLNDSWELVEEEGETFVIAPPEEPEDYEESDTDDEDNLSTDVSGIKNNIILLKMIKIKFPTANH